MTRFASALAASLAAAGFALATAAGAGAATYASPTGSGTDCSTASPCSVWEAVNNSVGGSPVVLLFGADGQYGSAGIPITTDLKPKLNVTVEGEAGRPRPTIHTGAGLDFSAGGIHVNHVGFVAYDPLGSGLGLLDGSANDVFVHATGNTGSACMLNGTSTITNSVCQTDSNNYVALYTNNSSSGTTDNVTARNVTLYATSPTKGAGAIADAEKPTSVVHMTLVNVIARGADADIEVETGDTGAVATLDVTHSNYRKAVVSAATLNDNGGNQTTVDPTFSDASYHQASGSPTIDAGLNDPANGATDFDGDMRSLGSGTDIGADEFVPPTMATTGGATGVGQTTGPLTQPSAGFSALILRNRTVTVGRNGIVTLNVPCPATALGNCAGTASLKTAGKVALKVVAAKKKKVVKLGSKRFSIPPGTTGKVKIKLSRKAFKYLKAKRKLKAIETVVAHDSRNVSKTSRAK